MLTRHWLTLMMAALLAGCSDGPREEVIEQYAGGEKRVVAVYAGRGSDEPMIERRTYDLTGDILSLVDLVSGETFGYMELHPELSTARGLRDAMQGRWYTAEHEGVGTLTEQTITGVLEISEGRFESHTRGEFVTLGDPWEFSYSGVVAFVAGTELEFTLASEEGDVIPDLQHEGPRLRSFERLEFSDSRTFTTTSMIQVDNRLEFTTGFVERYHRDEAVASQKAIAWSMELAEGPYADSRTVLSRLADIVRDDPVIINRFPEWHADVLEQAEALEAQADQAR